MRVKTITRSRRSIYTMLLTLLNSIVNCLRAKFKLSLIVARLQTGKMDWDSFIMLFDTIHAILLLIVYEKKLNCLLSSLLSKGKESIWIKIHAYSWVLFSLSFFSFKIIQIDYYIITYIILYHICIISYIYYLEYYSYFLSSKDDVRIKIIILIDIYRNWLLLY